MDWQLAIVIVAVVAAAAYVGRATWRTWRPKPGGCGGGCGCATPQATTVSLQQLTLRPRPR